MRKSELAELSVEIHREYKNKHDFNIPHEFINALVKAKSATGKYPVYSGKRRAGEFVKFLTAKELKAFKQFEGRKPRWKCYPKSKAVRFMFVDIADTYAGGVFPDYTPYSVDGCWTKRWGVCYSVSIFVDGGRHIATEKVESKKPLPMKKVVETAVANALKNNGKCYDGYWY